MAGAMSIVTETGPPQRWVKRMPFRVLATEHPLPLESAPPSVRDLGLRLRVDRIDELPDGRLLIVDYKTGRAPPALGDLWGQRPRAPQLPLYAIAGKAEAIAFAQISAGDIRWIGVGQDAWGIDGVITPDSLTKGSCADWEALRASWWTAIDRLARDILTGDFSVDRWDLADAQGQWAMATRVHELPDEGEVTA